MRQPDSKIYLSACSKKSNAKRLSVSKIYILARSKKV